MACVTELAERLNVMKKREKYKRLSALSPLISGLEQLNAHLDKSLRIEWTEGFRAEFCSDYVQSEMPVRHSCEDIIYAGEVPGKCQKSEIKFRRICMVIIKWYLSHRSH